MEQSSGEDNLVQKMDTDRLVGLYQMLADSRLLYGETAGSVAGFDVQAQIDDSVDSVLDEKGITKTVDQSFETLRGQLPELFTRRMQEIAGGTLGEIRESDPDLARSLEEANPEVFDRIKDIKIPDDVMDRIPGILDEAEENARGMLQSEVKDVVAKVYGGELQEAAEELKERVAEDAQNLKPDVSARHNGVIAAFAQNLFVSHVQEDGQGNASFRHGRNVLITAVKGMAANPAFGGNLVDALNDKLSEAGLEPLKEEELSGPGLTGPAP